MLAIAAEMDMKMGQLNENNIILYTEIEEEIFVQTTRGFDTTTMRESTS